MDLWTVGLITLVLLVGIILLGWQIATSLIIVSFLGVWLYTGDFFIALRMLGTTAYNSINTYSLGVIPLFVLMGLLSNLSGASSDLYVAANLLLRRVRGGLAVATIVANAFFAAITGVTVASAAIFSKVSLPEMKRANYDLPFAAGTVAGGSVLGMLIPPSLLMILYGPMAEVSVGSLFIAGILPGLLLALIYIIGILIITYVSPETVGFGLEPADEMSDEKVNFKWSVILKPWPVLLLIVLVLGGIWFGLFTPTEAGGVGAFGALLLALYKKKVTCRALLSTLLETGVTAGSIFIMLMSAQMYSRMLAISGVVNALADILTRLNLAPVVIVFFFMGVILIMGTLIDSISILLLTMPLMIPVVSAFGMDLVWFGVIAILATQIGLVTPPFGLGVFTIKASLTDELNELLEIEDIFKGSFPYFIMMTICLVILVLFPKITTYLPALM